MINTIIGFDIGGSKIGVVEGDFDWYIYQKRIFLNTIQVMGRGTMGRRIFCPLSRRPSNSRNHETIHTLPKECQKYSARTVGRKFLKAPQLAAG